MIPDTTTIEVPLEYSGQRLDKVLAGLFPDYSRSRLQIWIKQGYITVNGQPSVAKERLNGGELLSLSIVEEEVSSVVQEENIPIDVVYQDQDLIVINKVAGMVVHPAAGNYNGTLLNALLYHFPELEQLPRAGIVHRLDKETSGLLVIARNLKAHKSLVDQLQAREMSREYDAIIQGTLVAGSTIDQPIGRHPVDRKRMAVKQAGKSAVTHYRVEQKFKSYTHLKVKLETGRTHQIRVHMAHIKKPLLGDPVYGGRLKMPANAGDALRAILLNFRRQALHAARLGLVHPRTDELIEWAVDMPEDMQHLLTALADDVSQLRSS